MTLARGFYDIFVTFRRGGRKNESGEGAPVKRAEISVKKAGTSPSALTNKAVG